MTIRSCALVLAAFSLAGVKGWAQNSCGSTPPTGTCPAPAPPVQAWCAGNNSQSTCNGGTVWVGFDTTSPATGSWTNQFEGIDAATILASSQTPRPQPDPNGGVGPTVAGVGQYLESAANEVQAYDRATGNPIFSRTPGGTATPQPLTSIFGNGSNCGNASLDGIATYDRMDEVFVLGNLFNPGGVGNYYYCIAVSAPVGGVPASNLEGYQNKSYWNAYSYSLDSAIPKNTNGHYYFPDYARFGSWSDGFYASWDLEDIDNKYSIVGFEVCKLDKHDILAGLSSTAPVCYTYIPSYVAGSGGTDSSLIHSPLPADFEGNQPIPGNTAGEYFLAQVNPSNPGTNDQCTVSPCTSNTLAFWTWSGFVNGAAPSFVKVATYTPGCYDTVKPYITTCVPEPWGGTIDSLGDRLNYRLAYRVLGSTEYLAVAHTVQASTSYQRTGINYLLLKAGSAPSVIYQGDLVDNTYHYFLSMPGVAMDMNGDMGITFTVTGSSAHGSASNYDPSPFFITLNSTGKVGQPVAILKNSGSSGQDETDNYWGEYVSVSSDPNDDLTFWAVDEYMNGNQISHCTPPVGTGCTWATRVYVCKKGSGC